MVRSAESVKNQSAHRRVGALEGVTPALERNSARMASRPPRVTGSVLVPSAASFLPAIASQKFGSHPGSAAFLTGNSTTRTLPYLQAATTSVAAGLKETVSTLPR